MCYRLIFCFGYLVANHPTKKRISRNPGGPIVKGVDMSPGPIDYDSIDYIIYCVNYITCIYYTTLNVY